MDQLICASLSHTHYWYEVGVSKVSVDYSYSKDPLQYVYQMFQVCTVTHICEASMPVSISSVAGSDKMKP